MTFPVGGAAWAGMRPGDIIAFEGTGLLSSLIEFFTNSRVTHTGMVRWAAGEPACIEVTSSTISSLLSGPQTEPLIEVLGADYAQGRAWWLPLRDDIRALGDWVTAGAFIDVAQSFVRVGGPKAVQYDKAGLLGFVLRETPIIGAYICQASDPHAAFCSSYVTAILEAAGILRGINARQVSPQQLCEMKLYRECVQIWGTPAVIRKFNTV
jgi:hypothetical protein